MKVLHIVYSLSHGGVSTLLKNLIKEFNTYNVTSEILIVQSRNNSEVSFEGSDIVISECLREGSIKLVRPDKLRKLLKGLNRFLFNFRLLRKVRKIDPDLVHSHVHGDLWLLQLIISRMHKIPWIIHLHSPSSVYHKTFRGKYFFRTFLNKRFKFLANSKSTYEAYNPYMQTIKNSTLPPLPNAIKDIRVRDTKVSNKYKKNNNLADNVTVVGYLGRLLSMKRIEDLIHACEKASNIHNIHLLICGDGSYSNKLREIANNTTINTNINFTGFVDNPEYWLNMFDIYVLPSLFEGGSSISLIEAMSKGIPIIAANVSGINNMIRHENNGLLFESGNVDDLKEKIQRLIEDENLRDKLSKEGRRCFEKNYDIALCSKKYLNYYDQLNNI